MKKWAIAAVIGLLVLSNICLGLAVYRLRAQKSNLQAMLLIMPLDNRDEAGRKL